MLNYILIITGLDAVIARHDEEGASAVEYGLLVAGIAALVVGIVFLFGGVITEVFTGTCEKVATGATTTAQCA
jgi:pilus assembly protein Flp/PilA